MNLVGDIRGLLRLALATDLDVENSHEGQRDDEQPNHYLPPEGDATGSLSKGAAENSRPARLS